MDALAAHVAAGLTVRAAAEALGITERHGYRLSATPEFKAKVAEIRAALTSAAAGRLVGGMESAALTLRELAAGAKDERTKLAAAKAVLEQGSKLTELSDLQEQVQGLLAWKAASEGK